MRPPPLILASASPRRAEILKKMELEFEVIPSRWQESRTQESGVHTPREYCLFNAREKARDVHGAHPNRYVLGADTIVVFESEILEKPASMEEAVEMLQKLSGRTHEVFTGLALMDARGTLHETVETTRVRFRNLTRDDILWSLRHGDGLDKAGAYGIQSRGFILVERMEGCYTNVVGLPVAALIRLLKEGAPGYWPPR